MAWVPTSGRLQAAHLGKGTLALAAGQAAKMQGISWRIGHLIQGTIDGHQPQAEGKGSPGLWASQGTATLPEEVTHHDDPQAKPACREARPRWAK